MVASCLLVTGGLVSSAPASSATGVETVATEVTASAVEATVVKTADLSQFKPGNIISDAVFFNSATMTEAQIQSFLESKVAACRSGYTCLKDYYVQTRSIAADAMCGAYAGGGAERASRVIYKVAQACGINPQVILVMLQKEQGLITSTAPSAWAYQAAMGQGCPDTAACDTAYYGLFNQVYGGARQMKRYANPPGTSNYFTWYAPGKTWNVQYHPNTSCGRGAVYIENQATANLYYYTPYQPNAAALRAGYGEGDGCSSYGNRNFFNYFTDWFGSTQFAGARMLRSADTGETFLVSGRIRYSFASAERAGQYTWIAAVQTVPQSELNAYQEGGVAPRAVRTSDGNVYLLDSGARLRIASCDLAAEFGWVCAQLPVVMQSQVNAYRDGGWLNQSVTAGGTNWLIQSGKRREVLDLSLLAPYGMSTSATSVSQALAAEYEIAAPVLAPGIYTAGADAIVAYTRAGTFDVPAVSRVAAITRNVRTLTSQSFAFLQSQGPLPNRVSVATNDYVLSSEGWLRVDAYGTQTPFESVAAGILEGVPSAGSALGPHFVKEVSDPQIYLISGGQPSAVSDADVLWIQRTYGVPSRVIVVADTALGLPAPTVLDTIVRGEDGTAYLIEGTRKYTFANCAQVSDWGASCATLPIASSAQLSRLTDLGALKPLVRIDGGSSWLVQAGTRREVPDPSVLTSFGIGSSASTISKSLLGTLTVGVPVLRPGIYWAGAGQRLAVASGGTFRIPDVALFGAVTSQSRILSAESLAALGPTGDLPLRVSSGGRFFILTEHGWLQVNEAHYGGASSFSSLPPGSWDAISVFSNETRPHFVRERGFGTEFLVSGGVLQPVASSSDHNWIVSYFGVPSYTWIVPDGALRGLPLPAGLIVRGTDGSIALMDGTTAFRIASCDAVAAFGRSCSSLVTVATGSFVDGGALAPLLRDQAGVRWLVQSGYRREVPNPAILAAYGIGSAESSVSDALLRTLPVGAPVVTQGVYTDGGGQSRMVSSAGRVLDVPPASYFGVLARSATRLTPASVALMYPTATMPARIADGARYLVLTEGGWLRVDPSAYAPSTFTSAADLASLLPLAGSVGGPHFIRANTSSQLYLASGGLVPVSGEAEQAWITRTYGVPAQVWTVAESVVH